MIYLLLICVVIFSILIVFKKRFGFSALMTVGIGSAIGGNFYNHHSFPFSVFGFTASMEACLFTLFIFCVVLAYVYHGKKSAITLVITVLCAISFTAILEFFAILFSTGQIVDAGAKLLTFVINILATALACALSLTVFEKLQNKVGELFNVLIFISIANIIKSIVYSALAIANGENFLFLGTYIGMLTSLVFCGISYMVIRRFSPKDEAGKLW